MESNDETPNEFRALTIEEIETLSEEERNEYKIRTIQCLKEMNEDLLATNDELNRKLKELRKQDIDSEKRINNNIRAKK